LSNAIKFTPVEGSVTVTVRAAIDHDEFVVGVKVSGVGISAENQLRLFGEGGQFHANVAVRAVELLMRREMPTY
jgi:signal transduction histidine kinase